MKDVSYFSLTFLLFMFCFSLFTMELFGERVKLDSKGNIDDLHGTSPPTNFDTFLDAFTANFIFLTNDSVAYMYFNIFRVDPSASIAYLILFLIINQKIMLNLFLAILLQNFDQSSLSEESHKAPKSSIDPIALGLSCKNRCKRTCLKCKCCKSNLNQDFSELPMPENKVVRQMSMFIKTSVTSKV